ncbi:MAG TPA: TetR/AcrR family transcriptional regulator [Acetobacteraceae bacterium]|nr:TetR/AcrR family transcriptional regulator [Acetobacteraceae bacterium]
MHGTPYVTDTITDIEDSDPIQALEDLLLTDSETEHLRRTNPQGLRSARAAPTRSRRATRRTAEDKRRRLRDSASVLWAEQGMTACTVRGIALGAGVPHTMVFNLVGARDDVLAEIMLEHVITLSQQVRAAARQTSEASPPQRLEAMLTAYLDGIAASPHAHMLLHNALCVLPAASREAVRRRYRMLLDLLAQPLVLLAPSVGDTLAAELALTAVGSVSDALLWVDPAARYEVAVTVRRLTAMLLAAVRSAEGLGPQPGRGGPAQDCAQPWLHGDARQDPVRQHVGSGPGTTSDGPA